LSELFFINILILDGQKLHRLGEIHKSCSGYRHFDKRGAEAVWSGIQHDSKEREWPCWNRLQDTESAIFLFDI